MNSALASLDSSNDVIQLVTSRFDRGLAQLERRFTERSLDERMKQATLTADALSHGLLPVRPSSLAMEGVLKRNRGEQRRLLRCIDTLHRETMANVRKTETEAAEEATKLLKVRPEVASSLPPDLQLRLGIPRNVPARDVEKLWEAKQRLTPKPLPGMEALRERWQRLTEDRDALPSTSRLQRPRRYYSATPSVTDVSLGPGTYDVASSSVVDHSLRRRSRRLSRDSEMDDSRSSVVVPKPVWLQPSFAVTSSNNSTVFLTDAEDIYESDRPRKVLTPGRALVNKELFRQSTIMRDSADV